MRKAQGGPRASAHHHSFTDTWLDPGRPATACSPAPPPPPQPCTPGPSPPRNVPCLCPFPTCHQPFHGPAITRCRHKPPTCSLPFTSPRQPLPSLSPEPHKSTVSPSRPPLLTMAGWPQSASWASPMLGATETPIFTLTQPCEGNGDTRELAICPRPGEPELGHGQPAPTPAEEGLTSS